MGKVVVVEIILVLILIPVSMIVNMDNDTPAYITESECLDNEPIVQSTEHIEEPQWWTDEELDMLAAVIHHEAGSSYCTDRHQQLVGQVVINRVNSDKFPNTIYNVITQTKHGIQYASAKAVSRDMGNRDIISQRCYDNALKVLNNQVDCPDNIVWQAEFIQGKIYEEYETPHGTTYFCYE